MEKKQYEEDDIIDVGALISYLMSKLIYFYRLFRADIKKTEYKYTYKIIDNAHYLIDNDIKIIYFLLTVVNLL